jgi:predicted negative regulator of RcsB-dependent stress response
MNNSGKKLLGAVITVALGVFAIPTTQAVAASAMSNNSIAYQQYAEEEHHEIVDKTVEKTDEKVDETRDMGAGAAHAVKRAHAHHEANEYRHHGLRSKANAKVDEMHDEAEGAKTAVERTHEEHETSERN